MGHGSSLVATLIIIIINPFLANIKTCHKQAMMQFVACGIRYGSIRSILYEFKMQTSRKRRIRTHIAYVPNICLDHWRSSGEFCGALGLRAILS